MHRHANGRADGSRYARIRREQGYVRLGGRPVRARRRCVARPACSLVGGDPESDQFAFDVVVRRPSERNPTADGCELLKSAVDRGIEAELVVVANETASMERDEERGRLSILLLHRLREQPGHRVTALVYSA